MNTSHLPHRSILIHSRAGAFLLLHLAAGCGAGGATGGLGRDGRRRAARERLEYDEEEDERKGGGFLLPMPDSITIAAAARPTAIGEEHSGERAERQRWGVLGRAERRGGATEADETVADIF
jgi:hypothetical protein